MVVLGIAALAACMNASGELVGGEPLYNASPPPFACIEDDGTGPATWTALYDGVIGPNAVYRTDEGSGTQKGGCAGDGTCHGGADQLGARQSKFSCTTKEDCRNQLFASNLVTAASDAGGSASAVNLIGVMRNLERAGGYMPKRPVCAFPKSTIDRIRRWAEKGAPDD